MRISRVRAPASDCEPKLTLRAMTRGRSSRSDRTRLAQSLHGPPGMGRSRAGDPDHTQRANRGPPDPGTHADAACRMVREPRGSTQAEARGEDRRSSHRPVASGQRWSMVTSCDTSFLFALYGNDTHSARAIAWIRKTDQSHLTLDPQRVRACRERFDRRHRRQTRHGRTAAARGRRRCRRNHHRQRNGRRADRRQDACEREA